MGASRNLFIAFGILACSIFLSECGQQGGVAPQPQGPNVVEIPVSFQVDPTLAIAASALKLTENKTGDNALGLFYGLELVAATSYSMSLASCTSTLTGTVTTSSVKVYIGDKSCLLKLSSFIYNTNTYVPKSGSGFTTWLANDTATFVNQSNANDLFLVKVNNQLTQAGVATDDTVSYGFYQEVTGATQSIGSSSLTQSQSVAVGGTEAPNFVLSTNGSPASTGSVAPFIFSGLNSSGAGQFVFNLYCSYAMGSSGNCGLSGSDAGALALSSITYKLVGDSYNVSTGTVLTIAQLQNIMASGTSSINLSTDILSDNNKGFKTSTLTGPGAIASNPNMILVLSSGPSYTYFSIQLQGVSNN